MAYQGVGETGAAFTSVNSATGVPSANESNWGTDEAAESAGGGGSTNILGSILNVFSDAGKAVGTAVSSTASSADSWWDQLKAVFSGKRKAIVSSPTIPVQPAATPSVSGTSFFDQKIGPVPMPLALLGAVGAVIYFKKRKKRK